MLTDKQKQEIFKGLRRGVADTQIAAELGLKHMQVFNFRKTEGISAKQVVNWRYDKWISLLESGVSVEEVASRYGVKHDSVLVTLYRKRKFSFTDAKAKALQSLGTDVKKAMGVTKTSLKENRIDAWVALYESGMKVETIAALFDVQASKVLADLKDATGKKLSEVPKPGAFDW